MNGTNHQFACDLAADLLSKDDDLHSVDDAAEKVLVHKSDNSVAELNLSPFISKAVKSNTSDYFKNVVSYSDLMESYNALKTDFIFENNLDHAQDHVSEYAEAYLTEILASAAKLTNHQVYLVSQFAKNLDAYCAVKAIESLLNSKADLALLEVAEKENWSVHFDHLAIRCGSRKNHAAESIATMLKNSYDYVSSQIESEAFYQFADGWNAYPLYKMLDNGQVLRLFIDQSDAEDENQIIQHWNHVYGYTAHHLAMRASKVENGIRVEVALEEIIETLTNYGINIMEPTGGYTSGLLLQVFTRPESNKNVPDNIKRTLHGINPTLEATIENGKLLELVSRREMPKTLAESYFKLYGLEYDINNSLHSAPYYQYFLPAQAAHVIKTSQTLNK